MDNNINVQRKLWPLFREIIKVCISLLYTVLVVYLVFFARRRAQITMHIVNIVPVQNTYYNYLNLNPADIKSVYNFYTNLLGNIALFMPLPAMLILAFKVKTARIALLIAFVMSVSIEMLQYIFKIGIADVDDVLLNVLGAGIGLLVLKLLREIPAFDKIVVG